VRCGLCRRGNVAGALYALVLLVGMSWATLADESKLTAIFLVARDELSDPDFADSIVLVMNNLAPAPVGVIVNKPTQVAVSQLFPKIKGLAQVHDKVYFGGPVDFGSVWFLFRATKPPDHAVEAFSGVCLSASHDLLLQLLARQKPMDGLRIFVGHSGWLPGQLEAEIAHGDWKLQRAESDAIFNGKSEHPWPAPQRPSDRPTIAN
jgi:putative transcriptional regulator